MSKLNKEELTLSSVATELSSCNCYVELDAELLTRSDRLAPSGRAVTSRLAPLLVTMPHSGEWIPSEVTWLQNLPEQILFCDVDRFVDRLYESSLQDLGIAYLKTNVHRYVVDLNRGVEDVDADSVVLQASSVGVTSDSAAKRRFPKGWGLHWTRTTTGQQLMSQPMPQHLHTQLLQKYFWPFHTKIERQYKLLRSLTSAPTLYHLDLHSMPSVGGPDHRDPGEKRAAVVISDGEGRSASPAFRDLVVEAYKKAGLSDVRVNWPYMGGRITEKYGRPEEGQQVLQIELNRALYMDEVTKAWDVEKGSVLITLLREVMVSIQKQILAL